MCLHKCEWRGMPGIEGMPGCHCGKPACTHTHKHFHTTLVLSTHTKPSKQSLKPAEEKGRVSLDKHICFVQTNWFLIGDMGGGYLSGGEKTSVVQGLASAV